MSKLFVITPFIGLTLLIGALLPSPGLAACAEGTDVFKDYHVTASAVLVREGRSRVTATDTDLAEVQRRLQNMLNDREARRFGKCEVQARLGDQRASGFNNGHFNWVEISTGPEFNNPQRLNKDLAGFYSGLVTARRTYLCHFCAPSTQQSSPGDLNVDNSGFFSVD